MDDSMLDESLDDRPNDQEETGRNEYIKKIKAQKTSDTRKEFVKAAEDGDLAVFSAYMDKNACKSDPFDIGELVDMLEHPQLERMWKGLNVMCMNSFISLEDGEVPEVLDDQTFRNKCAILQRIIPVALATINKKKEIPRDLLETAIFLNGVLPSIPEGYIKVKNDIAKLFETWWVNELGGREHVILQTLVFLLEESLEPKPTARLFKRIWTLREGLVIFNLEEEECAAHLRELLLHCVIHVPYIKNDDGRKFLVFLFGLNLNFIESLHAAIKQQIPVCPKSVLDYYAEIYFKAWKVSKGIFREKIENQCIQDLMYHAVHASRSTTRSMASTLKRFLSYFHDHKVQRGVDDMLLRLYEPFIWRSVKVANGNVRANSVALLADAFPLNREGATNEEADNLVQKQLDIFQSLMYDPCPLVRAKTIEGVCQICKNYWELIPPNIINIFMRNLIDDLAWDGSSADVRVVVLKGLTHLVGQPLCHPMLNTLLPRLKNLIHDTSEMVRVAMVDLLLAIKGMRLIKVWHVVPMDHLLARLEIDSGPVTRRIVSLIHSSFMPKDKPPDVLLSRCVALLQSNPGAARKFYRYVVNDGMDIEDIGKFMLLLCNLILHCIMKEEASARDEEDTEEDTEIPDEEIDSIVITVHNTDIIAGFIESLAIMWTGAAPKLDAPAGAQVKRALQKKLVKALPKFFNAFQDPRICCALILLAGHVPSDNLPMFSKSCLSKLRNMDSDKTPDDYGPMLDTMCNWGKCDDVLEMVEEWFGSGLEMPSEKEAKDPKERKVRFQDPVLPKPILGLQYIGYLVRNPLCRELVLKNSALKLREIMIQLKGVMTCIQKRFEATTQLSQHCSDEFLVEAFTVYCKLEILLHDPEENEHSAITSFEELLPWADTELVSALGHADPQAGEKRALADAEASTLRELAEQLINIMLEVMSNMFLVGIGDPDFTSLVADFTNRLLKTDSLRKLIDQCVKLMYQITEFIYFTTALESEDGVTAHLDVVPGMLSNAVQALALIIRNNTDNSTKILHDVKPALSETVKAYYRRSDGVDMVNNDVMATIMAAVVSEITSSVTEEGEPLSCQKVQDLPPLSNLLMDVVVRQKKLCTLFLEELQQCVKAGVLHTLQGYTAVLHIIDVVRRDKPGSLGLKDCLTSVQLKYEEFEEPDKNEDSVQSELFKATKNLLTNNLNALEVVM